MKKSFKDIPPLNSPLVIVLAFVIVLVSFTSIGLVTVSTQYPGSLVLKMGADGVQLKIDGSQK